MQCSSAQIKALSCTHMRHVIHAHTTHKTGCHECSLVPALLLNETHNAMHVFQKEAMWCFVPCIPFLETPLYSRPCQTRPWLPMCSTGGSATAPQPSALPERQRAQSPGRADAACPSHAEPPDALRQLLQDMLGRGDAAHPVLIIPKPGSRVQ